MEKIAIPCLGCGKFIQAGDNQWKSRCATCRADLDFSGKFGSLIVEGTVSQRELAQLKREFYTLYQTDRMLEQRKAEFMQKANEQMNRIVQEVEQAMGQPVKELRARKQQLEKKMQAYMQESKTTELIVRDLLVELKNTMINGGNRPLYTQIVEKLREILKWTEEEMEVFVKSNYSEPQFADMLTVKPLPPGRRKRKQMTPPEGGSIASRLAAMEKEWMDFDKVQTEHVAAYHVENLDLPRMAVLHEDFLRTGSTICKVMTPKEVFILTGSRVRDAGLHQMIALQSMTKRSLKVADMEVRTDGSMFILVEGQFVNDPNTMRAFLAERVDDHRITGTHIVDETHIAVELTPIPKTANDPLAEAMSYFSNLESILQELSVLERGRSTTVHMIMDSTTAGQMDTPDNTEDLSLKYEEHNVGGDSYGDGTRSEGGLMTPNPDLSHQR